MNTKAIKKTWKVGELAEDAGLTVRTLHYYDEIGILKPTHESEGGHRIYNRSDLETLQKILTLKQLGFSLEKIKEAVSKKSFSLNDATEQLRADLQKRKAELEEIEARLENAQRFPLEASTDSILKTLSRMSLLEKHLSEEQLKWIHEQNHQFGPEKLEELRGEWIEATENLHRAMNEHVSLADWKTKSICMRWFGLACAFMGGNLDGPYELKKLTESEPNASLQLGIPGSDLKKIFEFIEAVLQESKNHKIPTALAYAQVGVQDLTQARKFYDRVLGQLDMKPIFHRPTNVVYGKTNPEFFISTKANGESSMQVGNTSIVGFWADSTEAVDAVYKEALACGGTSVQAPGFQDRYLYTCFVRDLDGNTLEIMKWFDDPARPTG